MNNCLLANKLIIPFLIVLLIFKAESSEVPRYVEHRTYARSGRVLESYEKYYGALVNPPWLIELDRKRLINDAGPSLIHHKVSFSNKIIFNATYLIDKWGFKKMPNSQSSRFHFVVAGDSNTFGEGISNNETFIYLLSKIKKKYNFYNLGVRGAGPNTTLAFLKIFDLRNIILEPDGYFIYNLYTPFLYERVIGSKDHTCSDQGQSPYFRIENNVLVYRGTFSNRLVHPIYSFICSHPFLNKLIKNLPIIDEDDMRLIAEVFAEMKKEYLKKFPMGKFYVVINKFYEHIESSLNVKLKQELTAKNINFIDTIDVGESITLKFEFDQHINKKGQKVEADIFDKIFHNIAW